MSETKKVKAVKAVTLPTTAAEQVAAKAVKEKPAKPAKLKFEAVTSTAKISAAQVKEFYEELALHVKDFIQEMVDPSNLVLKEGDLAFVNTSEALLKAVVKDLSVGLNILEYIEVSDVFHELNLDKLFAKELKALTKSVEARAAELEAAADKAEREAQEAALKAAELAKSYANPVRIKKADLGKATQLLKDAGIEFIDA